MTPATRIAKALRIVADFTMVNKPSPKLRIKFANPIISILAVVIER